MMIYVDATDLTHFLCARWFVKRLHSNVTAGFFFFFRGICNKENFLQCHYCQSRRLFQPCSAACAPEILFPTTTRVKLYAPDSSLLTAFGLKNKATRTQMEVSPFFPCAHTQLQTYICAIDLRDHSLSEEVVLLCHQLIRLMVNISSCCHHKQLSQPV